MTWTTPKTWVTGEALTASDLNTHLRDNLSALKAMATAHYICDESSDYSTTSTSFVDVDSTNLALSLTTGGGDVLVHFHGSSCTSGSSLRVRFNLEVDGVSHAADDGIMGWQQEVTSGARAVFPISFTRLLTGLSAGTHTIKLQWKVSGGAGYLYAGGGGNNHDIHPQFWARELI